MIPLPGPAHFAVGMASRAAMAANAQANLASMRAGGMEMVGASQRAAVENEQLQFTQARNDYLVTLYLDKGCGSVPTDRQSPR
jgi:hypothetical protein